MKKQDIGAKPPRAINPWVTSPRQLWAVGLQQSEWRMTLLSETFLQQVRLLHTYAAILRKTTINLLSHHQTYILFSLL